MNSDLILKEKIRETISNVPAFDGIEESHKREIIRWIDSGADLIRRGKDNYPLRHMIVYIALFDEEQRSILMTDHIKANLILPAGGHVDPGELPLDTVIREIKEEMNITADFGTPFRDNLFFVSITDIKSTPAHEDVSLWYILKGEVGQDIDLDKREMTDCKWMTFDEILDTDIKLLDPQTHRFIKKIKDTLKNI